MTDKPEKKYTEKQELFLEVLFDEAAGDLKLAKKLAGYSDNSKVEEIIPGMRDAIIEKAKDELARNGALAVLGLRNVLQSPAQAGASNKIKAAESILNRIGLGSTPAGDVELKVPQGGLIILPAKDVKKTEDDIEK